MGWVDAIRNLWVQDDPINFPALEREWTLRTFEIGGALDESGKTVPTEKLVCCVSGIEDGRSRTFSPHTRREC